MNTADYIAGQIAEDTEFTLAELAAATGFCAEDILRLVDEGVIVPVSEAPQPVFAGHCLARVRTVVHLHRDLGVNLAGAALALELLDEIEQLRQRLRRLSMRDY